MRSNVVNLGGSETVEMTPAFLRDPERLRYAASRLLAMADAAPPYPVMPTEQNAPPPPQRSLVDQIPDTPYDEEAERNLRTAIAMGEIRRALAEEERQAEAEKARIRQETETAFRATPMGQLMSRRYY
jgi:hypothetical protein